MTIGPAPMIRMVLMSVRFGMSAPLHRRNETIEEITYVVRSWAGFRMPLEAEGRRVGEREALVGAVEQRAVGDAHVAGKRRLVDREAVVLAGDQHAAAVDVDDRMVRAVVAELHLDRARAGGEAEDLVAQADAVQRQLARE